MRTHHLVPGAVGLLACTLLSASARASSFDPATGRLTLDGAIAIGFEDEAFPDVVVGVDAFGVPGNIVVVDAQGRPASAEEFIETELRPEWVITDPDVALEGSRALALGDGLVLAGLRLSAPELVGRRVEIRLWQRCEGTRVSPSVARVLGEPGTVFAGFQGLFPTGRATTDGWREWTSGPVDWSYGGVATEIELSFFDEQIGIGFSENIDLSTLAVEPAPYFLGVRALIDAIEVIDLGPAAVPAVACSTPTEAQTCGPHGVCMMGRCVDAAGQIGRLMTGDFRTEYLARRLFEIRQFAGGRRSLARLDTIATALEGVDRDDVGARELWQTIHHVYRDLLADGHARAPELEPTLNNRGVCLHRGEADLLPGAPIAPLVYEVSSESVFAALEPGDVLVSIDGVDPEAWVEAAALYFVEPGDEASRANVETPRIPAAAIQTGAELIFARCEPSAPTTPCAEGDLTEITVDLGQAVAGMWATPPTQPPVLTSASLVCDYRFRRIDEEARRSTFIWTWDDVDGVRRVQSNGHFVSPVSQVDEALGTQVDRLLYDHRYGQGGIRQTEGYIASFLMAADDVDGYEIYPPLDVPFTGDVRDAFLSCSARGDSACGDMSVWPASDSGGGRVNSGARLAILNSFDVSSSDFLAMRLTLRTSAPTRSFGVGSTHGGFGTYLPPPAYGNEQRAPWIGREDLVFVVDGEPTDFLNGAGVVPDEIVYQRQSDILQGVDTQLEAATEWVQQ